MSVTVMMVSQGAMVIGGVIWGSAVTTAGPAYSLLTAAALLLVSLVLAGPLSIDFTDNLDLDPAPVTPASYKLLYTPKPNDGPVSICVEFNVDRLRAAEFVNIMREVRLIHLRNGAYRWQLHEDLTNSNTYRLEMTVASWNEHLMQFERMTKSDKDFLERAWSFHTGESEPGQRIYLSYLGLQIALAFDLGFLQGYGPPENIDPLRDRFIGIVIGICIATTVFALIWPESAEWSARERLAACLRTIARLLRVGRGSNDAKNRSWQGEQLELEIAYRLSEANSYDDQAAFEELIHGSIATEGPELEDEIAATEEIYVCSLTWVREQRSGQTIHQGGEPMVTSEFAERLPDAMEDCADRIDRHRRQIADQNQMPIEYLVGKKDFGNGKSTDSLEDLLSAVRELQFLISTRERS